MEDNLLRTHAVLVGVEGRDEARDAVALGATLARVTGRELLLAAVCLTIPGPEGHGLERAAMHEAQRDLDHLAETVPAGVPVHTKALLSTSAVRGLHELADRVEASVMVLGPSHFLPVSRALHGDVALGTIHTAPCAVAIAPEGHAAATPVPPTVIGVAYVDSPEGREALDEAVALAERTGGHLQLAHVLEAVAPVPQGADPASVRFDWQAVRAGAHGLLEEAAGIVAGRVPVDVELLEGDATARLVDLSRELDLLVLGSRAYGPLARALLGSVSAGVVHAARCPVLVMPRGALVRAHAHA